MLEVAATPSYKSLLETLGKLTDWAESARDKLPQGLPPKELVQEFNEALKASSAGESSLNVKAPQSIEAPASSELKTKPSDLLENADFFKVDNQTIPKQGPVFPEQNLGVNSLTESQQDNLDHSLNVIDTASQNNQSSFLETAQKISEFLSKSANDITPLDLLQVQRLVGMLKVDAESGKKFSEGIQDTIEQLLEQQG